MPPSRSTRTRTSSASPESESSRHSAGVRPRVPALALRGRRLAGARFNPDLGLGLAMLAAMIADRCTLRKAVARNRVGAYARVESRLVNARRRNARHPQAAMAPRSARPRARRLGGRAGLPFEP